MEKDKEIDHNIYVIDCTGNACVEDEVAFLKDIWEKVVINKFGRTINKIVGHELIKAKIIKDSYGKDKQQHTFTLLLENGEKKLIKGRVLYRNGVWRKNWPDERKRDALLVEKYERGEVARACRRKRIEEKG